MKFPLTHPLHLVTGFIIWSIWFVAMYSGLSLGCMVSAAPETLGRFSWLNISLLVFTLATTAFLLWLAFRCWRSPVAAGQKPQRFILRVSAAVYLASAGATLAVGLPTIGLPPCL